MFIDYENIKYYWNLFDRAFFGYKKNFLIITVIGFLSGLVGGLGIGSLIPLVSFVTETGQTTDIISTSVRRVFSLFDIQYSIPALLIMMVVLFFSKAVLNLIAQYINAKTAIDFENKTRVRLFKTTLSASWPYLSRQKVGYLEKVLTEDINQSTQLIFLISTIILAVASLIIYAFIAYSISALITVSAIGFGVFIILSLKLFFKRAKNVGERLTRIYKLIAHFINENSIGAKVIKAMGIEKKVIEKAEVHFNGLKNIRKEMALYNAFSNVLMEPVSLIFIVLIFGFSYSSPAFNIGSFAATIYLIQKIFTFTGTIQGNIHHISQVIPNLKTVIKYQNNAEINLEKNSVLRSGGSQSFSFDRTIEFSKVDFAYKDRKALLSQTSFTIKKGEMVGLIGPSGAGKTTIADLILRLFTPSGGKILLDGKDVFLIDIDEWRKKIEYVPQDPFLINDTIENNIKFYDDSITEKDIIEAAKIANIYDFVQKLPDKFKTAAGERGVKLSGGQRQRIVLARALARKPEILILDEATSAIDTESEVLIQKSINDLRNKMTIFVIAHRLSTILNSDRLLVLENGKIIEEGNPKKLLESKDSHFYKIYNLSEKQI
ncbi:MAG: ABC transporter ATP-binding protein [Patescibacteria group bacterium]